MFKSVLFAIVSVVSVSAFAKDALEKPSKPGLQCFVVKYSGNVKQEPVAVSTKCASSFPGTPAVRFEGKHK